MNRWKRLRHRLEYAGVCLLAWLVPKFSRRTCHRVGGWLGEVAFLLDKRGRSVALANLEAAFTNRYAPAERTRIARASYRNFTRTMLDLFWAPRLTPDNVHDFIDFENEESIPLGNQEGGIFTITHAGNFEWIHIGIGLLGRTGMGVAETFKNPLLTDIFTRLRGRSGNIVVEQERSMVRMFKYLKTAGTVGMLIDLNLRPDQPSVVIESFGHKTCVTQLHVVLHQRTGAPIYPTYCVPAGHGRYRIRVGEPLRFSPEASAREVAQGCWDVFEPFIRENPELWMWSYKHWRYRPKQATRPYPPYANISPKFEKLLQAQELTKPER